MDPARLVIRDGAIAVAGTRIAAIGPVDDLKTRFAARQTIDAKGCFVHPGFIDTHLHISQQISRGFDELLARNPGVGVNYADWKAQLHDFEEAASTRLGALDLLKNGFTAFVDGGTAFSPDVVAEASASSACALGSPIPTWDESEIMDAIPG